MGMQRSVNPWPDNRGTPGYALSWPVSFTLIYPTIRQHLDEVDVMDEALEEHHVAHVLINELKTDESQ